MNNIQAYPLCWPSGWKRTEFLQRKNGKFGRQETIHRETYSYRRKRDVTVGEGVQRILETLSMMGVDRGDVIVSTNVRTRLDGLPRSGEKAPDDPGAAVYWHKDNEGETRCMAIDRYTAVADNLAAIAATLEAMRAIDRHGGAEILNRAFTGFAALPASTKREWWEVLDLVPSANESAIRASYLLLARKRHPDVGGSNEAMAELNAALQEALG